MCCFLVSPIRCLDAISYVFLWISLELFLFVGLLSRKCTWYLRCFYSFRHPWDRSHLNGQFIFLGSISAHSFFVISNLLLLVNWLFHICPKTTWIFTQFHCIARWMCHVGTSIRYIWWWQKTKCSKVERKEIFSIHIVYYEFIVCYSCWCVAH